MTTARLSRDNAEIVVVPTQKARLSRISDEILVVPTETARLSRISTEVLRVNSVQVDNKVRRLHLNIRPRR